jgi:hypothetical protein
MDRLKRGILRWGAFAISMLFFELFLRDVAPDTTFRTGTFFLLYALFFVWSVDLSQR